MLKSRAVVVVIVAMVWLSACVVKFDVRTTVAVVTGIPSIGAPTLPSATPRSFTPTPPPTSTQTPTQTETPTLTPTLHPLSPYFVESLRARSYTGGTIEIVETLEQTSAYTSYLIAYPSDGLRITGMMNVPVGEGPFPVILLNHGHYDLSEYTTGRGTKNAADIFARHGYLTLASDYRGHAGSVRLVVERFDQHPRYGQVSEQDQEQQRRRQQGIGQQPDPPAPTRPCRHRGSFDPIEDCGGAGQAHAAVLRRLGTRLDYRSVTLR